jgi:phage-related protein
VNENGEQFNVGKDYNWRLLKKGLENFSAFESNVTVAQDYGRNGGSLVGIRLNDKTRTIKICNVDWKNSDTARMELQKYFIYGQKYKIYVTIGETTRWADGVLYRMAIPEPTDEDYKLNVTMSFKFGDPFLKSEDNFGKNIASLTPMFAFPWLSRMDKQNVYGTAVGIYNFEREVHLYNDGSYEAYPTIKITFKGIVTNPEIRINDGFIRVLGTFNSDDEIVIDCSVSPMTVKNNGENILGKCDRESEFDNMNLQIGDNTLSFIAYSGSDDMNVFVYYYKPYTMI